MPSGTGSSKSASRRNFIRNSAIAAGGFFIIPRHVLGGKGYIAPSDQLAIAAIGAGGKARENLSLSTQKGGARIIALCDVDDRQAVWARSKFPSASYFHDFRKMLEKEAENIDAVIITSPDHMHAVHALPAMKMGKHIYLEKPLTHDIAEARLLTQAAAKYKVVTQMGNQGSSGKDTRLVEAWIQQGIIGKVHTVHVWTNRPVWPQGIKRPSGTAVVPPEVKWDLWLGTAPEKPYFQGLIPANWRGWVDYGTGSLGDMGCHFLDVPYRSLNLGYPTSVECSAGSVYSGFFQEVIQDESYPPSAKIHLQFTNNVHNVPVEVIWYDGGIKPQRPRELLPDESMGEIDGGMIFEGSEGKIMAGLFGRNPTLLPKAKMKEVELPKPQRPLVEGDWSGHQQQWVDACKAGYGAYTSSPFEEAGPLTETVLMGNLAVLSYMIREKNSMGGVDFPGRKKLLWNGEEMKITNFSPANKFVKRIYRGNWDINL